MSMSINISPLKTIEIINSPPSNQPTKQNNEKKKGCNTSTSFLNARMRRLHLRGEGRGTFRLDNLHDC